MNRLTIRKIKLLALVANISLLSFANASYALSPKHVAVPPEQVEKQRLQQPSQKGVFSHSTMLPIQFKEERNSAGNKIIQHSIYLDGTESSPLVLLGPAVGNWQLSISNAQGHEILNERNTSGQIITQDFSIGGRQFNGRQLQLPTASYGKYEVTISRESTNKSSSNEKTGVAAEGFLLYKGDPQYKVYSHLDSNLTVQNKSLNIVAYLVHSNNETSPRNALVELPPINTGISSATVTITSPTNQQRILRLSDNGLNGDALAGDGKFSVKIPTREVGVYTSQIQINGVRPDGIEFSRTVTDLYPIEAQSYKLKNAPATIKLGAGSTASLSVPVKRVADAGNVYLAGELWGTNPEGERAPAAWIGGVVSSTNVLNHGQPEYESSELTIGFDTRWITRQQLRAPFMLKSVRLQSVNNHVPISQLKRIPIQLSSDDRLSLGQQSKQSLMATTLNASITNEMLMGYVPVDMAAKPNSTNNPKLLLVHGYCASGASWNTNSFSNSALFQDYDQSRSHEEFAQLIINFGAPYSSYGVVAHSQGGAAALHLYSRYWSGLDYSTGGTLIQSVGTPYQGTALAGNLAALGSVFGIGCGTNTDLTYSGASNWLSTIPSWARSEVDYYTTSFNTKWWRYDYCHLATDLFLDDPEDGTTEKWSGQLSGAVNMGHKKGWCHTTGMRDPAQYNDSSRNSSMNSRAAR